MCYWHREESRPGRKGPGREGGEVGCRRGKTTSKHDNLQVSQFQEAGWPDTLGKHPSETERAEQSRAGGR